MGFGTWLARKGNIGGTARAVANAWKKMLQDSPGLSNEEMSKKYIEFRYGVTGETHFAKKALEMLKKEKKKNPLNLAWIILSVENDDEPLTLLEHMAEWKKIMKEEIQKMGITID